MSDVLTWLVDARAAGPPVGSQGTTRGTCLAWALSGAHAHEAGSEPLSVEYLHWASGNYPPGRGHVLPAHMAITSDGQPADQQWPYDENCNDKVGTYAPPASVVGPFRMAKLRVRGGAFPALLQGLEDGRWPIVILRVTNALRAAAGGVVQADGRGAGRHAVVAVGMARYDGADPVETIQPGSNLLCLRNSWGLSWGSNGLAFITEDALDQCVDGALVLSPA